MRVLFTFVGGLGHLNPLMPIARAALAASHTVAIVGLRGLVPAIEAAGFTAIGIGTAQRGETPRIALRAVDLERELRDVRERFADRGARSRATELLPIFQEWRPDVVVCDEMDFGSMLAAETLGLPYASVVVIASGALVPQAQIAPTLGRVRADFGLPPDPGLAMLSRYLVLAPVPPSLRDPAFPLPPTAHMLRPAAPEPAESAAVPAWLADLDAIPTVYFTLGTIFNVESGDLFGRVLAGLRDLPINVVATVGRDIDPAEFGTQPPHIHIERFVAQSALLPRCAAVVSHAGSGSVIGALAQGLPAVLIPLGADQPYNAARCAALGAAVVLDALAATPEDVRVAVEAVLREPGYRHAAERIRDESAALPEPEHAVALLERLAAERQPIVAGGGA